MIEGARHRSAVRRVDYRYLVHELAAKIERTVSRRRIRPDGHRFGFCRTRRGVPADRRTRLIDRVPRLVENEDLATTVVDVVQDVDPDGHCLRYSDLEEP